MAGEHQKTISQLICDKIIVIFEDNVHVDNVLTFFRAQNVEKKVLTNRDIDAIDNKKSSHGRHRAAGELLDRLSVKEYPKWYDSMQEVLRLPDVKLGHLANDIDTIRDKIESEMVPTVPYPVVRMDSTNNGAHHARANQSSNCVVNRSASEDDFDLDETVQVQCLDPDDTFESDMPKPKVPPRDYPKDEGDDPGYAEVDEAMVGYSQVDELCSPPSVPVPTKSSGYLEPVVSNLSSATSTSGGGARSTSSEEHIYEYELQNVHGPSSGDQGVLRARPSRRSAEGKKKTVNDFSHGETVQALCEFDGWHRQQTDKDVIHTYRDILHERRDGHYLLWYWEKKKRPAICVSHNGKLVTYIIHKREDPSSPTKYVYYVDKTVTKATLYDLIRHHLNEGLPIMNKPSASSSSAASNTIRLLHAIQDPHLYQNY